MAKSKEIMQTIPDQQGVVRADESFTAAAFIKRIGTTKHGLVDMRKRGLKARQDGAGRVRYLGSDYLDYLRDLPVAEIRPSTRKKKASVQTT